MNSLIFIFSICLLMYGHAEKLLRWKDFIGAYETPSFKALLRASSLGYAFNQVLPFKIGDIFRSVYAGKHLKNGVGLALATVIIDRFLDAVAVSLIFFAMYFLGVNSRFLLDSARFYLIVMAVLLLAFIILKTFSSKVKQLTMKLCSIFNDRLKLNLEKFFWTLINSFRYLKELNIGRIIMRTLLMWASYTASYALLGLYLSKLGSEYSLEDIMLMLFSSSNLSLSTTGAVLHGSGAFYAQLMIVIYNFLPPVLLYLATRIPYFLARFNAAEERDRHFRSILPQIEEKDQLSFLDDYFSEKKPELIKNFIAINRDISIIADYSSGSNAYTVLCMGKGDSGEIFYRKYAFGTDGDKLYEQKQWIQEHETALPMCKLLRCEYNESYCYYDMAYLSESVGMFTFVHSHPLSLAWNTLRNVLDTLNRELYIPNSYKPDKALIESYIDAKVTRNLKLIADSEPLRELLSYDKLLINHHEYMNLPLLKRMFDKEHLLEIFSDDMYSDIHGDLTIENIICISGTESLFYLIDPNTGNIHESPFLDYAKLLQSLHGGYEFMMRTDIVSNERNNIDYISTHSTVYSELLSSFCDYLQKHYSSKQIRSIFYHELVHWLRLLPYRLRKDPQRAPMFYAGFIIVANDVYERYEKE